MSFHLPQRVSDLRKEFGFNSQNFFTTTNPKTGKNSAPTLVLHLEPVRAGVCPAAGSCAALCLHKAGNPVYLNNKVSRRGKRTDAFMSNRAAFLDLLVIEAARFRAKGYIGIRLNGTSDIAWESEMHYLGADVISRIGSHLSPGNYSIIEIVRSMGFLPYDYTKRIDRNFALCSALSYHLTLSWGGKHDDVIFDVANTHKLNVAAPLYGYKKKAKLPTTLTHKGKGYKVVDGDVTDWRREDPPGGAIVGLRLKRTPGQTENLARRFCLA